MVRASRSVISAYYRGLTFSEKSYAKMVGCSCTSQRKVQAFRMRFRVGGFTALVFSAKAIYSHSRGQST